jgi:hypothetical protein
VISWFLSIWDGAVCKTVEPGSNPGRDLLIARHAGSIEYLELAAPPVAAEAGSDQNAI